MKNIAWAVLMLSLTAVSAVAQFAPGQVLNASALNAALASPTITGGTIDNAPIGTKIRSTGQFTSLNASGAVVLSGTVSASSITVGMLNATTVSAGSVTLTHPLSPAQGGTGIANNAAATFTRSGNHALTLLTTATTGLTLPAAGTLATLAGAETLTNKTINGGSVTTPQLTASEPNNGVLVANQNTPSGFLGVRSSSLDTLTATRNLDIFVGDSSRLLVIGGDVYMSAFQVGNDPVVLTTTGSTSLTLPVSGTLATKLSGTTGSIGGGALLAGACTSGTVSVTGSTTGMTVSVSPNTYPGDGSLYYGYVSTNGTVTVKVCGVIALTLTASTYNVRVHP